MLGAFFRIVQKLGGVAFVFLQRRSSAACAGDRTNLNNITNQPDMQFRRAANERKLIAQFETEHVGRRVNESQAPIQIEGVSCKFGFEALRENYLKHIARPDVIFRPLDCGFEVFATKITARRRDSAVIGRDKR